MIYFNVVSSTGIVKYTQIRAFLKKQPNIMTQYISISTENETITLTGNHLMYGRKDVSKQFYPM